MYCNRSATAPEPEIIQFYNAHDCSCLVQVVFRSGLTTILLKICMVNVYYVRQNIGEHILQCILCVFLVVKPVKGNVDLLYEHIFQMFFATVNFVEGNNQCRVYFYLKVCVRLTFRHQWFIKCSYFVTKNIDPRWTVNPRSIRIEK